MMRLDLERPDVQMRLQLGDMLMESDGDLTMVDSEACLSMHEAGIVRLCGDPDCPILHVLDDAPRGLIARLIANAAKNL